MKRVDYINKKPIRCFPTPIINLDIIKQGKIEFSTGEFVNFNNNSTLPLSTYFYKYKEDLLILDTNLETPIAHIVLNSKVIDTIEIENLNKKHLSNIKQIINADGVELNIKSFSELVEFYKDFLECKKNKENLYTEVKNKFQEMLNYSERMRKLDEVAGTKKVLDFIDEGNFRLIKSKTNPIHKITQDDIKAYKASIIKSDKLNTYITISNILEKEFFNEFKLKNKEYINMQKEVNQKVSSLNNIFENKWFIKDNYKNEKEIGALLDSLNEMYCNKLYDKEDIKSVEDVIATKLRNDNLLFNSFLDWVDLCPLDKEDMKETLNEIIEHSLYIKISCTNK